MATDSLQTPPAVSRRDPLTRFGKSLARLWHEALLTSPAPLEGERGICRCIHRHRRVFFPAALITASLYCLLAIEEDKWEDLGAWLVHPFAKYSLLFLGILLVLAAVQAEVLGLILKRLWRVCRLQHWRPLWLLFLSAFLVAVYPALHPWSDFACVATGLLLALCLQSPPPQPEKEVSDSLHRGYIVRRLLEHFRQPQDDIKRIAIMGTWGTGKTTLLHSLRKELRAQIPELRTAWVNPWRAATVEEARACFASAFDEALAGRGTLARPWSRHPLLAWLPGLKTATGLGLTFDLVKLFDGDTAQEERRLIARINRRLSDGGEKLVIFVDDMERAEAGIVRKLFPLLDRLRDIDGCTFIFAVDRDRITRAFEEEHPNEDETKGYMDKVFDLKIDLAPPRVQEIAEMCWDKIKAEATQFPKLHAAFPYLRPILPGNPRIAIHFLAEAKQQEFMFLHRYDHDERPFFFFFLCRLSEVEFPGFCEAVCYAPKKDFSPKSFLDALSTSDQWNKTRSSDEWREFRVDIAQRLHVKISPTDRQTRLDVILEAVFYNLIERHKLEDYGEDFSWAKSGPTRLIDLTRKELKQLDHTWRQLAGKTTLAQMLQNTFHDYHHFTPLVCTQQFVGSKAEELKKAASKLFQQGKQRQSQEQTEMRGLIERLHSQFRYLRDTSSADELSLFGDDLFACFNWLSLLLVPCFDPQSTNLLRTALSHLHLELADAMPFDRAFHWQDTVRVLRNTLDQVPDLNAQAGEERRHPDEQWFGRWGDARSHLGEWFASAASVHDMEHLESSFWWNTLGQVRKDLKELHRRLNRVLHNGVVAALRTSAFSSDWPSLGVYDYLPQYGFFGDPSNWLWLEDEAALWKDELDHLVHEARTNTFVAAAGGLVATQWFAKYNLEKTVEVARGQPEYFAFFWRCASLLPSPHEDYPTYFIGWQELLGKLVGPHPDVAALLEKSFPESPGF